MKIDFAKIGKGLMEKASKESSAPGVVDGLFPYIYVAANRMSTRAICRWLAEEHNVTISHSTVAKALRESNIYLESIAEAMGISAGILARAGGVTEEQILFYEPGFQMISGQYTSLTPEAQQAFDHLESTWYDYPEEFRAACHKFFTYQPEDEVDE